MLRAGSPDPRQRPCPLEPREPEGLAPLEPLRGWAGGMYQDLCNQALAKRRFRHDELVRALHLESETGIREGARGFLIYMRAGGYSEGYLEVPHYERPGTTHVWCPCVVMGFGFELRIPLGPRADGISYDFCSVDSACAVES